MGENACSKRLESTNPVRWLSTHVTDKRPMTRFIQYPFDKTKMAEVRQWVNDNEASLAQPLRATSGVQNVEFSFCPGQGWLAARYIFTDLQHMKDFPESAGFNAAKKTVLATPHYDSSREPVEFKGF